MATALTTPHAESAASMIGHINFDRNPAGKRSAGKPPATFDEAGAGDVAWLRCSGTRRRKSEQQRTQTSTYTGAPVLDPTCDGLWVKLQRSTLLDYIPCRRHAANQTWLLSAIMAHNLNRELQMSVEEPARCTTEQRAPWWSFVRLGTHRMRLIQRAGRLTTPKGRLTLTLSANPDVQAELFHYLRDAA
jgi:hypothetical protein